jgi:hypothetical protein
VDFSTPDGGDEATLSRRRFVLGSTALVLTLADLVRPCWRAPRPATRRACVPARRARARGSGHLVDPCRFGGVGDGQRDDTAALQRAIDAAPHGGGVRIPAGTWRSGTLRLRSGVTLELAAGATLLASPAAEDFLPPERLHYPTYADLETSDFRHALLVGEGLARVAIVGRGTIDGNRTERFGPKPIALRRCRDVTVRGITIHNAPNYCVSLGGCDDVLIDGVVIRNAFSDGIDPDSCRRVRIVNCDVESDDDAIVLKGSLILGRPRASEDITVLGCRMRSPSNGFKIGSETSGDFRRIRVARCRISGRPRPDVDPAALAAAAEGGGIAIEAVDGGSIDDVVVSRVELRDVPVPLFVRLGNRGRGQTSPRPGTIRNLKLRRIVATGASALPSSITGMPNHPVERVEVRRMRIQASGGGRAPAGPLPAAHGDYPRVDMFGDLPAAVLYVRHANDVELRQVEFVTERADRRPLVVAEHATVRHVDASGRERHTARGPLDRVGRVVLD